MKLFLVYIIFFFGVSNITSQVYPDFDDIIENTFPVNDIGEYHGRENWYGYRAIAMKATRKTDSITNTEK
ncbi:hypothetical protein [Cellulophaga sp. Hel_I_12]|uniref:hypothetical protein n=1 Tax=Cellulophaga sp. Hel_I_12 TaxID=1249972 RepID=UPI0006457D46|nr:hypothetical protein [Cellulophaga sp. Hel_I_12]